LVEYKNSKTKIQIICKEHGVFEQRSNDHLMGKGCSKCSCNYRYNTEEVIEAFKKVHGDKYDYSLVEYINTKTPVKIICKEHGVFEQTSNNHLKEKGCPSCSINGPKQDKPGILYYLRVEKDGMVAYKIGITNRTVKERFGSDMQYITILKEIYYEYGEECYQAEQHILKEFNYAKWTGPDLLQSGNSELFKTDVLLLECCILK